MNTQKETIHSVARLSWPDRIGMNGLALALSAIFPVGIIHAVSRADDNSEKFNILHRSTSELKFAVSDIGQNSPSRF